MQIKKEKTKRQRYFQYFIVTTTVIVCSIISLICFLKQKEMPWLAWASNLLLNASAGISITAIFIYISEGRLRRYRLQESLENLRFNINRIYRIIDRIQNGTKQQKIIFQ